MTVESFDETQSKTSIDLIDLKETDATIQNNLEFTLSLYDKYFNQEQSKRIATEIMANINHFRFRTYYAVKEVVNWYISLFISKNETSKYNGETINVLSDLTEYLVTEIIDHEKNSKPVNPN